MADATSKNVMIPINILIGRVNSKASAEISMSIIRFPYFDNDVWYVQHLSFKTDVKMVLNLIRFTLDRKNAEVRSAAGRGDFMGYSGGPVQSGQSSEQFLLSKAASFLPNYQRLQFGNSDVE